jgi:hypothetical protein
MDEGVDQGRATMQCGVRYAWSLMTAQEKEPPLEVRCCDSDFDKNLPPSKVCWWLSHGLDLLRVSAVSRGGLRVFTCRRETRP